MIDEPRDRRGTRETSRTADREGPQPAEGEVCAPIRLLSAHLESGKTSYERRDRHLAFEPGKRAPQADMRIGTECHVPQVLAMDIEPIGVLELRGIAMSGAQDDGDRCARGDRNTFYLLVAGYHPTYRLDRPFESQDFLHNG